MIRYMRVQETDEAKCIYYCSESVYEYSICTGQKCIVLVNEDCFVGILQDCDEKSISFKKKNGVVIKVSVAQIDNIYGEEEIGTIQW